MRHAVCLWQVHKARLKNGRQVAVKVQYLGLESAVSADLSTLSLLGAVAALVFPNSFEFGYCCATLFSLYLSQWPCFKKGSHQP